MGIQTCCYLFHFNKRSLWPQLPCQLLSHFSVFYGQTPQELFLKLLSQSSLLLIINPLQLSLHLYHSVKLLVSGPPVALVNVQPSSSLTDQWHRSRGSLSPQSHTPSFLPASWLHLLSLLSCLLLFSGDNRIPQSLIFGLFSFYHALLSFSLTSVSPICPSPSCGTSSPSLFHVLQFTRYPKRNTSKLTPYSPETPLHLHCPPVQLMTAASSPSSKPFHVILDVDACLSPTLHIWPSGRLAETVKQTQNLNMSHHAHYFLSYSSHNHLCSCSAAPKFCCTLGSPKNLKKY